MELSLLRLHSKCDWVSSRLFWKLCWRWWPDIKDRKTILKTTIQALSKDLDYYEFILDLEKNSARIERSEIDLFNHEEIGQSFKYLINDTGFHKFLEHYKKKIVDV